MESLFLSFVIAWFLLSLLPGQGVLSTISHSTIYGRRAGIVHVSGQQLGILTHYIIVSSGLGLLLSTSSYALEVIKWCGALYLIYLGLKMFLSKTRLDIDDSESDSLSDKELFSRGFMVNFTNPKGAIFVFALLPQFIDISEPQFPQYFKISIAAIVLNFLAMMIYLFLAEKTLSIFKSKPLMRNLNYVFGCIFIAFAAAIFY